MLHILFIYDFGNVQMAQSGHENIYFSRQPDQIIYLRVAPLFHHADRWEESYFWSDGYLLTLGKSLLCWSAHAYDNTKPVS